MIIDTENIVGSPQDSIDNALLKSAQEKHRLSTV